MGSADKLTMVFIPGQHMLETADDSLSMAAYYETLREAVLDAAASASPAEQSQALLTATRLDTRADQLLSTAVNQDSARRTKNMNGGE